MPADLIVGFEGTPAGRDAVALGRRLALATGARPTVVYVRSPKPLTTEIPAVAEDYSWGASVARTLDEARSLLADLPDARFMAVAETAVARVLDRVAEEAEMPLIVLGATHRSGAGRIIPGTTADAVIRHAPCAVAIAPAGYAKSSEARPFGLVAAAVDGGDETERVARVAARIAANAEAALRLITVADGSYADGPLFAGPAGYATIHDRVRESPSAMLGRAAAAAAASAPVGNIEREVVQGDVADEVAWHSHDADLLVIGSRAYGPLRRVVLGSATRAILRAAVCPVLVVPRGTAEAVDDAAVRFGAAALGAVAPGPAAEERGDA
jgi:nucleotide-binding universal stress UspA family protein